MIVRLDIEEGLLLKARRLAAERKTTISDIVNTSLRDALAVRERATGGFRLRTHTFTGNGLQSGVSWGDWIAVRSEAYDGRGG